MAENLGQVFRDALNEVEEERETCNAQFWLGRVRHEHLPHGVVTRFCRQIEPLVAFLYPMLSTEDGKLLAGSTLEVITIDYDGCWDSSDIFQIYEVEYFNGETYQQEFAHGSARLIRLLQRLSNFQIAEVSTIQRLW